MRGVARTGEHTTREEAIRRLLFEPAACEANRDYQRNILPHDASNQVT